MQLIHDRAEGYFFVRATRPHSVVVLDRELNESFLLAPDRVVERWPASSIAAIDAAAISAILELEPEVVILGSGPRQEFPDPAVLAPFLRQGIGIEVMDNAAAGRTYNLLAAEGRRVVGAFLLPASDQRSP